MLTPAENERLTRVEGDAPMGRMMREHYWMPFALSSHLVHGDAPLPVRLLGENYMAFRAQDGRIGFFDELCPHRRASLLLGRIEGNGVRCIYHGWKLDVSGCVVEAPTQQVRPEQFAARVRVAHFPVHESGGLAWAWLGGAETPAFPELPFAGDDLFSFWCVSRVPCNWLQGVEGTLEAHGVDRHPALLGDQRGQVEREAEGVIETEGLLPADLAGAAGEDFLQPGEPALDGLEEATLLGPGDLADEAGLGAQLGIHVAHQAHDGLGERGEGGLAAIEQPGVTHGPIITTSQKEVFAFFDKHTKK